VSSEGTARIVTISAEEAAQRDQVMLDALMAGEQQRCLARQATLPALTSNPELLRALDAEIQRAHEAARAQKAATPGVAQPDAALLRERGGLAVEIAVARAHGVDGALIARAEAAARDGALAETREARRELQAAWEQARDSGSKAALLRELAAADVARAEMALAGAQALANQERAAVTAEQRARIDALAREIAAARNPMAPSAPDGAHEAREASSALLGRAQALQDEVRMAAARARVAALAQEARLAGRLRAIARQIAGAMAGRGFQDYRDETQAPQVEELSDGSYQVSGMRNDAQPGMGRDDKVTTFTLTPDGSISYDFGGYIGDGCQAEAQAIFDGLRRQGVVIVDEQWHAQHQGSLTYEQAQESAPLPAVSINKDQTLIAEALIEALKRMGYRSDEIQVSSIGGELHFNAQKDGLGYYQLSVDTLGDVTRETHSGASQLSEPLQPLREAISAASERAGEIREAEQRDIEQARRQAEAEARRLAAEERERQRVAEEEELLLQQQWANRDQARH
jgi:hypothetical protein